ncbi:12011_t:CDS:2, partial [Funneliformis caledonium]
YLVVDVRDDDYERPFSIYNMSSTSPYNTNPASSLHLFIHVQSFKDNIIYYTNHLVEKHSKQNWVLITTNVSQITTDHSSSQLHSTKLTFYERYSINIVKFLLPAFSLLAVIGSIKEFDSNTLVSLNHSLAKGDILIKISTICFLTSMVFYMILITYFALKYSNKPIQSQLKVLVLYIVGALLLIGLIYRTFMIFAPSTDKINKINKYSWIFYVFESLPEVLILIILGGVILGEWFFEDDNIDLTNIKTVSIGSVKDNRVNATSNV